MKNWRHKMNNNAKKNYYVRVSKELHKKLSMMRVELEKNSIAEIIEMLLEKSNIDNK
jgi:hypothetical protein